MQYYISALSWCSGLQLNAFTLAGYDTYKTYKRVQEHIKNMGLLIKE